MNDLFSVRLKSARLMNGLSMDQLARRLEPGISKQAIGKYEKGRAFPNSENLIALTQALGVPLDYFFRPEQPTVNLSEPVYRKRKLTAAKTLASIREKVRDHVERCLLVESFFPPDRFHTRRLQKSHLYEVHSFEDVESAAEKLRRAWDLGSDAINNVVQSLEDRHVIVALLEAEEEFDGLSCWANDSITVIVCRNLAAGDRVRSSICHELGHLLLKVEKVDEEKAAQRFSAAFLVPRQVVLQELGSTRQKLSLEELHQLKHKYGMSMQMWIYRARDLNIITDSHFREWFIRFRQYGHKQEPGDSIPPERPLRYQNLIFQACAEDLIPEARAAELLGWPINEVRARMLGAFDATGG